MTARRARLAKSRAGARKKRPGRWKAGESGNPAGRKPGVPNKATVEVRDLARSLVEDATYRKKLQADLRKRGNVKPAVECMLWYYAYGKPKQTVEVELPDVAAAFRDMPPDRVADLAERAAEALRTVRVTVEAE